MYNGGEGVSKDLREAHVWFSLAAANGHEKAGKLRDAAAKQLSSADLLSAQKEAAHRHAKIQGGKGEKQLGARGIIPLARGLTFARFSGKMQGVMSLTGSHMASAQHSFRTRMAENEPD